MRTPSLVRRVVVVGMGVTAVLAIGLDVLLYLSLRSVAAEKTDAAFESQAALLRAVVTAEDPLPTIEDLARRLAGLGIEATLQIEGGPAVRSRAPALEGATRLASREVSVMPGVRVVLFQPPPEADVRVRRLLAFEAVATPLVIALAGLLLRWIAEVAMAPLDEIAAAARRTTLGRLGERLEPDRPDTRLGQMATAYDRMLDALEGAVADAQDAEASTRRFLDDAAHQLRSPITSIRASAETLQRNITPAQRDKLFAAIVRDSERAGRLMAGLLRMARLGHPQLLQPRPTDLIALCEEQADQLRSESPHLEITVHRTDGAVLDHPEVDAGAVAEIVANLLDNARRHARSYIRIAVDRDDGWLRLQVADDGPGIPSGQADMAFDRFVSLDTHGGSGLGLAIARELARAHEGDLSYEDGAFVIGLPLWQRDAGGGAQQSPC